MVYFYDSNQVRYEFLNPQVSGLYNWLFFPGGPGADSRYLRSLHQLLKLPGNVWLIDLPGNGANIQSLDDFDKWLELFLPIVQQFENPIIVGHSFGGMLPLLFPKLERLLKGLVILNSAPSLWLKEAVAYAKRFELPDLSKEMRAFTEHPTQATFQVALEACTPYYFPKQSLEKGRAFLSAVPFRFQPAVWWQRKATEINYSATWIPQQVPTLIIGGRGDAICPFSLFQHDQRFNRPNITMVNIEGAGHFSWFEQPQEVRRLVDRFTGELDPSGTAINK